MHRSPDNRIHGGKYGSAIKNAQLEQQMLLAQERDQWLRSHHKTRHSGAFDRPDRSRHDDISDAQREWERKKRLADGKLSPRSAPTGHVPVDEYVIENPNEIDSMPYEPTAADLAVTAEDYAKTAAQIEFDIKKAYKDGNEDRAAGLKIVLSMRDTTEKQRKARKNKGRIGDADAWLME